MTTAATLLRGAAGAVPAAVLIFLVLPIVLIIVLSFSAASYMAFPPPGVSLRWYAAFFDSSDWRGSALLSVEVAAGVVVLATGLGTSAALGMARVPRRLRAPVAALFLSPLIVPSIVVAIGIYFAFSRFGLVGTATGLVLGHTCLAVPFVFTSVSASLARLDRRLEQAALSLGATPFATFRQVTLPLIRPGVLVGALFAFATSFDELIVSLFLSGSGAVTLPRRMWDDIRYEINPTIAAVSTLTIVLTSLMLGAAFLTRRRAERMRSS